MVSTLAVVGGAACSYAVFAVVNGLRIRISQAKKSGLPYVVVPCSPWWIPWQLTHKMWLPLIHVLPKSWWEGWLPLLVPDWSYNLNHQPFARLGTTFLLVSPFQVHVFTNNAEAIRQISQRREQFPKLTEIYSILRIYGENVLTTEGVLWRLHRKVTSASFNERNAALVFGEAIRQAQGMCRNWVAQDGRTITTVDHDTMRLALNIIGYVGFGLRLLWPGETLPAGTDPKLRKYGSLEPPEGHTMSFADSIATLLERILLLLLMPRWLLRILPFKVTKAAAESNDNYLKYMDELYTDKLDELRQGNHSEGMDLMGQLVRSKYGDKLNTGKQANGRGVDPSPVRGKDAANWTLARDEIVGNAFIMLVAGHETTANAMHFSLVELATNPAAQRALQRDVDSLFGTTDPLTWNYEAKVNALLASNVGAAMNETLRLMPAVVEIPKKVAGEQGQVLTVDGEKHLLPPGAMIALVAVAAHRNPRYWPAKPSKIYPGQDDLNDFVPERWFRSSGSGETEDDAGGDTEDYGGYRGPDTSASMFRPERGAYVPFSEGARSCLGRRIAQVEIIAALAVIFQRYSLELAVDEWATDEEVAGMSAEARVAVYAKAQAECRRKLKTLSSILTLKLHGTYVPLRIVERGQERFLNVVDA